MYNSSDIKKRNGKYNFFTSLKLKSNNQINRNQINVFQF